MKYIIATTTEDELYYNNGLWVEHKDDAQVFSKKPRKLSGTVVIPIYQVQDEDGKVHNWKLSEVIDEINRDRSEDWTPYNESDWQEGWDEWVEGDVYTMLHEYKMIKVVTDLEVPDYYSDEDIYKFFKRQVAQDLEMGDISGFTFISGKREF